jgi:NNP family nitrate/nitrite transporter-like MFS transporter
VGGLGAFGGFVIPPVMAFAVDDLGQPGYSIGFVVFVFLALVSLGLTWMIKYSVAPPESAASGAPAAAR